MKLAAETKDRIDLPPASSSTGVSRRSLRILAMTRYSMLGPSSRYRIGQYIPLLKDRGIEVDTRTLLDDAYINARFGLGSVDAVAVFSSYVSRLSDLARGRNYDLLWLEGELMPWIPRMIERLLDRSGLPYVVEYDDAWFHRYADHKNPFVRHVLGSKIDRVMREAAHVIAGNSYIAQRASAVGAPFVTMIPTAVDLSAYRTERPRQGTHITIGWIGSPSTSKYLELVREPLQRLQRETGCAIALIGAAPTALAGLNVDHRPWSLATEIRDLSEIDIGISPLLDGPWERGKCGLKLIQYMAAGKPVVVSPVGVNATLVEPSRNGFLARTPEEWYRALLQLHEDRELRVRLGSANITKVAQELDRNVVVDQLAATLRNAVRGGVRASGAAASDEIVRVPSARKS